MTRALLFEPSASSVVEGSWELIARWKATPSTYLWLDLEAVSSQEREKYLEGELELHPLAVQDALRDRHPPKIERFDNALFIMIRGLSAEPVGLDFEYIDISMFVNERLLVTRRTGRSINTDLLWESAHARPAELADPYAIALDLMGRVLRRYLNVLLEFETRLDAIETEIFEHPDDVLLHELTRYRNRLKALRRIFRYHEQLCAKLDNERDIPAHLSHDVQDVHDQAARGVSLSDFQYEVTSDIVDGYLALSSHRLNQVMRVLTLITVVFVPLSFIAGLYGMNFEYMPELKFRYGYFIALGVMASISLGLLALFKRKGWL